MIISKWTFSENFSGNFSLNNHNLNNKNDLKLE